MHANQALGRAVPRNGQTPPEPTSGTCGRALAGGYRFEMSTLKKISLSRIGVEGRRKMPQLYHLYKGVFMVNALSLDFGPPSPQA